VNDFSHVLQVYFLLIDCVTCGCDGELINDCDGWDGCDDWDDCDECDECCCVIGGDWCKESAEFDLVEVYV